MSYYYERDDLKKFNEGILGEDSPEYWEYFMKFSQIGRAHV